MPATSAVAGVPMRSRRARTTTPRKATLISAANHNRCTIHAGIPASCPRAKKGPIGKR
jgi:hypothetical protein